MPRTRRTFSAEFKSEVVLQLLRGEVSQAELCRKHKLTSRLLATWKTVGLERMSTLFDGAASHDQVRDQARIAELERLATWRSRPGPGRQEPLFAELVK